MIFPDLPKHRQYWAYTQINKIPQNVESAQEQIHESKLSDDTINQISADEWFARHFPDQVVPLPAARQPFKWSDDPLGVFQFCLIVIFIICWAWYWHQFQ